MVGSYCLAICGLSVDFLKVNDSFKDTFQNPGNGCLLSGQAMAGAGGGGFIFVLTEEPNMVDDVKAVIKSMKVVLSS